MIIKVCGMRDADNIRAVVDAGADMIEFLSKESTLCYHGRFS